MNKLFIFIGLIVVGAGIFFGPMVYKTIVKQVPKQQLTIVRSAPMPAPLNRDLLNSQETFTPKINTDKIKNGINDILDLGTKASGFIIGIIGIASTFNHTRKTRKSKKTVDKDSQKR